MLRGSGNTLRQTRGQLSGLRPAHTAVGLFHGLWTCSGEIFSANLTPRREGRKIEAIPDKIQLKLEKKNHAR